MSLSDYPYDVRQTLALAGVFQAAVQVHSLATRGLLDQAPFAISIESILVTNPERTLDIYGGQLEHLQVGARQLKDFMQRDARAHPAVLRYAMSILVLQHKLMKQPQMLEAIGQRLENMQHQVQHFGSTDPQVIHNLSALYQDTLSHLSFRIQVQGEPEVLKQNINADKVRALLLAGVRSAMLWRQSGGKRWRLLFGRKKILKDLQQLGF